MNTENKGVVLQLNTRLHNKDVVNGIVIANTGLVLNRIVDEFNQQFKHGPLSYISKINEKEEIVVANKHLSNVHLDFPQDAICFDSVSSWCDVAGKGDNWPLEVANEWFKDMWIVLDVKETFMDRHGISYHSIEKIVGLVHEKGWSKGIVYRLDRDLGMVWVRVVAGRVE